jgi:hypothetical protein
MASNTDHPVIVGVCDDASSQYLGRGYITTCRLCGHREVVTYATHAGCYAADLRMYEHILACRAASDTAHAAQVFAAGIAAIVRDELAGWVDGCEAFGFWDIADDRTIALAQGITGMGEDEPGRYDVTDDAWTTAGAYA